MSTTSASPPSGRPPNARGRRSSSATRLKGRRLEIKADDSAENAKKPRGAEVRDRVLVAALECFGAFGFAGTSTRAVAERAGVSHPLLLYHFQSKEQLWRSMMEDVIGRYRAELDARLAEVNDEDPVAGLKAFIENFVEFSARVPQLHRIMTQQSTQGSDRIQWLIEAHLRESFIAVCDLIERAQDDRKVRSGDPARLYYAVIGLAGTLFSVSTEFKLLTRRDVFSPKELRETVAFISTFLFR